MQLLMLGSLRLTGHLHLSNGSISIGSSVRPLFSFQAALVTAELWLLQYPWFHMNYSMVSTCFYPDANLARVAWRVTRSNSGAEGDFIDQRMGQASNATQNPQSCWKRMKAVSHSFRFSFPKVGFVNLHKLKTGYKRISRTKLQFTQKIYALNPNQSNRFKKLDGAGMGWTNT